MRQPKAKTNQIDEEIDQLLAEHGTPTGLVEVLLPNGKIYKFKVPETYGQKEAIGKLAGDFLAKARSGGFKGQELDNWVQIDDESVRAAFRIHYQSAEPKISQVNALKIVRAIKVTEGIVAMLDAHERMATSLIATQYIENAKKELGMTPSGEPSAS